MSKNLSNKTDHLATETVWLLAELTAELNQITDLDSLYALLRRKLGWLFDYDRCTLALRLDPSLAQFTLVELTRSSRLLRADNPIIPLDDNWPGRVLRENKPFFIDDTQSLPLSQSLPADPTLGLVNAARSLMLVPLLYNNQTIGSLNFSSRLPHQYPMVWRNLVTMLAVHLSSKVGTLLSRSAQEVTTTPAQQARANLGRHLAEAVENDELTLVYQPQVCVNTRHISGVEALLRWYDPELGQITPSEFIPLAEEMGLIVKLGQWVLEQACRQAVAWQEVGFMPIKVCVNVSAVQFERADFIQTVTTALEESRLIPCYLELELTESLLVKDLGQTAARINQLRALGVEIAIDDFGTGYSSLQYLQDLPLDTLKIDRSFIQALGLSNSVNLARPNQGAIVGAIISLAHALNLKVVVEGVETEAELEMVGHLGCDLIQGYFFSPPVKAEDLLVLLKRHLPSKARPDYLTLIN